MSIPAFVGRGSLLVSVLGASRGFIQLSGESEITAEFDEDNESISDARNGVVERVDWYARNYRLRLLAQCHQIDKDAWESLLKATHTEVDGTVNASHEFPDDVVEGEAYLVKPNLTNIAIADVLSNPVSQEAYTVDTDYGLVTFLDVTGYTQPFTATYSHSDFDVFALDPSKQIFVEALFKGFNKVDGQKCMAHFYRLVVDLTDEFKLVQRGFSPMSVRLQATPDLSQAPDATLGNYGRIMLL